MQLFTTIQYQDNPLAKQKENEGRWLCALAVLRDMTAIHSPWMLSLLIFRARARFMRDALLGDLPRLATIQ